MAKPLEFWFTAGSTYTYLTAHRIGAAAAAAGVELVLKPFYLGEIFKDTGFWPFHPDTSRTRYMWHDIGRTAEAMGLGPNLPAPYPAPETPLANRLAYVANEKGVGLDWLNASYKSWFEDGLPAGSAENLAVSLPAVGLDPEATIAIAEAPETEAALQSLTDEAREKEIFGAPSFWVDGGLFWGNDRLQSALDRAGS